MKYVGWGVWIKPELTLFDVTVICDLARQAFGKSLFVRIQHYKKIVAQVTTLKIVFFWHALMVNRILKAADLLGGEKTEYDPKEKIHTFIYWLAPRVGQSPHALLHDLNSETLQKYAAEAINFKFHKDSVQAMIQHMPTKYFEEVQKMYDYKRSEARIARNNEIEETINDPDQSQIDKITGAFGYDGGFHG